MSGPGSVSGWGERLDPNERSLVLVRRDGIVHGYLTISRTCSEHARWEVRSGQHCEIVSRQEVAGHRPGLADRYACQASERLLDRSVAFERKFCPTLNPDGRAPFARIRDRHVGRG